jgi:hypothetical protein
MELHIEKVNIKNRKEVHISSDGMDVSGVGPYSLMKLHQCTTDVLFYSISN